MYIFSKKIARRFHEQFRERMELHVTEATSRTARETGSPAVSTRFQNADYRKSQNEAVLELCCFEWFQNGQIIQEEIKTVLELCCFEWFQNLWLLNMNITKPHLVRHWVG